MTSLCDQFWQLFLAQGLCMGLGCGLMFCPVLSLMETYFARHRSLAVGLAATGSATGGLIFPAVVEQLLPLIAFPWTVRTLGLLTLAMLLTSFILFKQRVPPGKSSCLVDWTAFRESANLAFAVGIRHEIPARENRPNPTGLQLGVGRNQNRGTLSVGRESWAHTKNTPHILYLC